MIRVHHLNNSRSQRILWLLEELGLPYEVVRYQRDAKTMLAPSELRAVHPLGKSPVLDDDGLTEALGELLRHEAREHVARADLLGERDGRVDERAEVAAVERVAAHPEGGEEGRQEKAGGGGAGEGGGEGRLG